uniref:Uncharacterized protein n=1 Tax=Moniliophthora roreri TaxID=221103 RepID=A0A0W0F435_MONRR
MPPPADPRALSEYPDPLSFSLIDHLGQRTDGNGYSRPNINDTRSLITCLTSEPRSLKQRFTAAPHAATEPPASDTLVYPNPTPDTDIKPKLKQTDNTPPRRTHTSSCC